jgi:hypothetical protein
MEKECLELLLRGMQSVVICPARGIERMRLPSAWRTPLVVYEAPRSLAVGCSPIVAPTSLSMLDGGRIIAYPRSNPSAGHLGP